MKKAYSESKQTETKELTSKNPDLVGKNVMQKDGHARPKPMNGRDAGERGKSWEDHFGKPKKG
jgi:hypothetical protein